VPVRKNAFKLTKAESDTYINAVTAMISDGTYVALVKIHADMSHNMHDMGQPGRVGIWRFLSWHRAYILRLEEELVKRDKNAFIPYWHWVDGGAPPWIKGFTPTVDGNVNSRTDPVPSFTDQTEIDDIMKKTDYFDFTYALEKGPHNHGHVALGFPMRRVPVAPCDPMFWMHHGEVDRIWAEWQVKFAGKGPVLSGSDAVMDPWKDTVATLASIKKLGYSYA
jgi:tyrosinase